MKIGLVERFGTPYLGRLEGEALQSELAAIVAEGQSVAIDFSGVETVLPSFFNALLAPICARIGSENVKRLLRPLNATQLQQTSWRAAAENAKTSDREVEAMWEAAREALLG